MRSCVARMLAAGLLIGIVGCNDQKTTEVTTAPPQAEAPPKFPEEQVPLAEPQPVASAQPAPQPAPVVEEAPPPPPEPIPVDEEVRPAPRNRAASNSGRRQAPRENYATPSRATRTYTVKKGDTLQKISQKFYGTTRNWQRIFQANRKVLKDNPDRIQEGMKLVIP